MTVVTVLYASVLDKEESIVFLRSVLAGNISVMFASKDVLIVVYFGNDTCNIFFIMFIFMTQSLSQYSFVY